MNDPHHDHQNGNMKVSTPTRRYDHHCKYCLVMGGKHSRLCPVRIAAGEWIEVNGVEYGDFADGRYLVETVNRRLIAVYLSNDEERAILTWDDDTREIDPQTIVRLARIVEV